MTATTASPYALRKPCRDCPFRSDIQPFLRAERAREIAKGLQDGAGFACHKTTVPDPCDDGALTEGPQSKQCAGALITLERQGLANQRNRIAERLGLYDAERLDMAAPVFGSLAEWVSAHDNEEPIPHCGVVGPDCQDPPGWAVSGGLSLNVDPGTADATCVYCGEEMCPDCRAEDGEDGARCVYCAED